MIMVNQIPENLIKFRAAEVADIELLNRISVSSKRHWNYPEEWILKWIDDLSLNENDLLESSVIVLEIDEVLKGFCSVSEEIDHYEVLHLWLLPELIGRNLGKALLTKTLEQVIQHDLPVLVEADPNAEAFYKKQGFVTYDKKESFPKGRYLPLMKMQRYLKANKRTFNI